MYIIYHECSNSGLLLSRQQGWVQLVAVFLLCDCCDIIVPVLLRYLRHHRAALYHIFGLHYGPRLGSMHAFTETFICFYLLICWLDLIAKPVVDCFKLLMRSSTLLEEYINGHTGYFHYSPAGVVVKLIFVLHEHVMELCVFVS